MERERCRGMTVKRRRCKLHAIEGRRFCRHHLLKKQKVKRFLRKHKQEIIQLLEQGESDPLARELYAVMERQIKRRQSAKSAEEHSPIQKHLDSGRAQYSGFYHASNALSVVGVRSMSIL